MINIGDKVICSKLEYISTNGENCELPFTIGDSYDIQRINNRLCVYIDGYAFGLYKDDVYIRLFSDYFITIAEYREQQIKTILDE